MAAILAAGITAVVCIPIGIFIGALLSVGQCKTCGHLEASQKRMLKDLREQAQKRMLKDLREQARRRA